MKIFNFVAASSDYRIFKFKYQMKKTLSAIQKFNKKIILWPNADAGYDKISQEIRKLREKNELKNYRVKKIYL